MVDEDIAPLFRRSLYRKYQMKICVLVAIVHEASTIFLFHQARCFIKGFLRTSMNYTAIRCDYRVFGF